MGNTEECSERLYLLSEELEFMIKAGKCMAKKSPNSCYVGACVILEDINNGIKSIAEKLE